LFVNWADRLSRRQQGFESPWGHLGKLRIGEDVPEMLQCDLEMELDAIPDLRAGIAYCEAHKDYVTRDLFDAILVSEEEHVDWLETQLGLIKKLGLENYQLSQS
jgi:bacterioferritin